MIELKPKRKYVLWKNIPQLKVHYRNNEREIVYEGEEEVTTNQIIEIPEKVKSEYIIVKLKMIERTSNYNNEEMHKVIVRNALGLHQWRTFLGD